MSKRKIFFFIVLIVFVLSAVAVFYKTRIEYDPYAEANTLYSNTHYVRGNTLIGEQKYREAVSEFTLAIRDNPESAAAYQQRGISFQYLGMNDEAFGDYSSAISLDPSGASYYGSRGILYGKIGDWDSALADFDKAVKLVSDNQDVLPGHLNNRAMAYWWLGQKQEALSDYEQSYSLYPDPAINEYILKLKQELGI